MDINSSKEIPKVDSLSKLFIIDLDGSKRRLGKRKTTSKLAGINKGIKSYFVDNYSPKKIFPFLTWIKAYNKSFIVSDVIAGLITAIVMVVQGLAIAQILSISPEYGIYSTFIGGFVGFLFGTSKDSSFGPSLIVGIACARYNLYQSPIATSIMAFFSGILLTLAGFFKFGFIMEFISYSVLTGFISAGAVTIITSQLPGVFGLAIANIRDLSSYEIVYYVCANIHKSRVGDVMVGVTSFGICYGLSFLLPIINRKLKSQLTRIQLIGFHISSILVLTRIGWIILIGSIVCYLGINHTIHGYHFSIVGPVKSGFPVPWNPFQPIVTANSTIPVSKILSESVVAFFLAPILTFIEALSSSRNFAKIFNYQVNNNLEFLALGLSNIIGSFFRNFPVGAALARTAVNALSGSKSRFSGLLTSIIMIIVMLWLMPVISNISKSSLSGCICAAGVSQINFASLMNLWRISKLQMLPWIATFLFGLYRLEFGMLAGFVVSCGFILFRELRPRVDIIYDSCTNSATFFIKGAIHFPGSFFIVSKLRTVNRIYPNVATVIIDCSTMYETDTTVVEELKEAFDFLKSQSIRIELRHLKKGRVQTLFLNAGLKDSVYMGLRTSSCHANLKSVKTHQHFIAYKNNPRDICESVTNIQSKVTLSPKTEEAIEGVRNYLEKATTLTNRKKL